MIWFIIHQQNDDGKQTTSSKWKNTIPSKQRGTDIYFIRLMKEFALQPFHMQQVYFYGIINQLLPNWSIINFLQNMHIHLLIMEYYPTYIGTNDIRIMLISLCMTDSQMKTLKVWLKFTTHLDCLVSWQQWYSWFEQWPTGGSTIQEYNTTVQ
jgi:hypothetical protein